MPVRNPHPEKRRLSAMQTIKRVIKRTIVKSTQSPSLRLAGIGGGQNIISGGVGDVDAGFGTQFYNGSIIETIDIQIYQNGANAEVSIEKMGGGDLTCRFDNKSYDYDTTPADTLTLPPGTDSLPIHYWVFLKLVAGIPTLDYTTNGWPSLPFCPVVRCSIPSAAGIGTFGVYRQHNYTDHLDGDYAGHLQHLNERLRVVAVYKSGVAQSIVPAVSGSGTNVYFSSTSGIVDQLHPHTFPAISMPADYVYVVNDTVTPYNRVNNLNYITLDSTGASLKKYFALVVWGICSESGTDSKLMVNLPSGSYNTLAQLIGDDYRYANYDIPIDYQGTGFLNAEILLSKTGPNFTTIDLNDLLGYFKSTGAGSGDVHSQEFQDSLLRHQNTADFSKEIQYDVSGVTTATVRTITYQDFDGTMAYLADIPWYVDTLTTPDSIRPKITTDDVRLGAGSESLLTALGELYQIFNASATAFPVPIAHYILMDSRPNHLLIDSIQTYDNSRTWNNSITNTLVTDPNYNDTTNIIFTSDGASTLVNFDQYTNRRSYISLLESTGGLFGTLGGVGLPGLSHFSARYFDTAHSAQYVWDVAAQGITRNNFCKMELAVVSPIFPARDYWIFTFDNSMTSPDIYNPHVVSGNVMIETGELDYGAGPVPVVLEIHVQPVYGVAAFSSITAVGGYVTYLVIDQATGNEASFASLVPLPHHFNNLTNLYSMYRILIPVDSPKVNVLVRRQYEVV